MVALPDSGRRGASAHAGVNSDAIYLHVQLRAPRSGNKITQGMFSSQRIH